MFTITFLDEEMTKTKVIDLDELYNFDINNLFQLKSFGILKSGLNLSFFKIQNLNCSNFVIRKDN